MDHVRLPARLQFESARCKWEILDQRLFLSCLYYKSQELLLVGVKGAFVPSKPWKDTDSVQAPVPNAEDSNICKDA